MPDGTGGMLYIDLAQCSESSIIVFDVDGAKDAKVNFDY